MFQGDKRTGGPRFTQYNVRVCDGLSENLMRLKTPGPSNVNSEIIGIDSVSTIIPIYADTSNGNGLM